MPSGPLFLSYRQPYLCHTWKGADKASFHQPNKASSKIRPDPKVRDPDSFRWAALYGKGRIGFSRLQPIEQLLQCQADSIGQLPRLCRAPYCRLKWFQHLPVLAIVLRKWQSPDHSRFSLISCLERAALYFRKPSRWVHSRKFYKRVRSSYT